MDWEIAANQVRIGNAKRYKRNEFDLSINIVNQVKVLCELKKKIVTIIKEEILYLLISWKSNMKYKK